MLPVSTHCARPVLLALSREEQFSTGSWDFGEFDLSSAHSLELKRLPRPGWLSDIPNRGDTPRAVWVSQIFFLCGQDFCETLSEMAIPFL